MPPLPLCAVVVRVCRPRPDDPNRASGEGRDGSDPPFFTAGAVRHVGGCPPRRPAGCPTHPLPSGGRSRLHVSLREGSPARVRAGRRAETSGAMLDRLIRAFLVIGGVSAACAWSWPGRVSRGRSRGGPRPLPHANRVRRRRRVVLRRARRGGVPGRPIAHQHIADLIRPDGRQSRAPVPPAALAAFAVGRRAGHRRRRGASPGPSHRDHGPPHG